jgi:hypothetical protein
VDRLMTILSRLGQKVEVAVTVKRKKHAGTHAMSV